MAFLSVTTVTCLTRRMSSSTRLEEDRTWEVVKFMSMQRAVGEWGLEVGEHEGIISPRKGLIRGHGDLKQWRIEGSGFAWL